MLWDPPDLFLKQTTQQTATYDPPLHCRCTISRGNNILRQLKVVRRIVNTNTVVVRKAVLMAGSCVIINRTASCQQINRPFGHSWRRWRQRAAKPEGERNITNSTTTHKLLFVFINPSVTTGDMTVCYKFSLIIFYLPVTVHRDTWPCIVTRDRASWHVTCIVTRDRASWHLTVHRDIWPASWHLTCIVTCDRASWHLTCIVTCDRASWHVTVHRDMWPASWHMTVHRDIWPASWHVTCIVTCDRASWHVTVHRNKFLYNKTNQMHLFHKFILAWKSICFGQFLCPSSGVYSLYTQQLYMSYRFLDRRTVRNM